MAVLHRTTLEHLPSGAVSKHAVTIWVHDPDMSPVDGVDLKYWKLTGDVLSEMSQAEKDAVDTAELAATKIVKAGDIDRRTGELIDLGFTFASKQFSLSLAAQSKMTASYQVKGNPALTYPITWNTIDDMDSYDIDASQDLEDFYLTAVGTVRVHLDSGTALKGQVRDATTIAAVLAVVDAR